MPTKMNEGDWELALEVFRACLPVRGGFGAKIHLKTDHDGLPMAFELTGGEAADSPLFEALIDAGPDEAPRAVVCDKGYDSDANRAMAHERGALRCEKTARKFRSIVALAATFILLKSVHMT